MSDNGSGNGYGGYIAALWEYPNLCISIFGVQLSSEEGARLYSEAGIDAEVMPALHAAGEDGLLLVRPMMSEEGQFLMQYWRSYEDMDRWARKLPHARWWQWLRHNQSNGVSFYHELYVAKSAEAIYTEGMRPVGPAVFCSTEPARGSDGRSKDRQRKFVESALASQG